MVEDRVEKAYCFGIAMVEKFFDLVLENARRTGLLHPGRGDIRRRLFASSEVRQLSVSEDEDEEVIVMRMKVKMVTNMIGRIW